MKTFSQEVKDYATAIHSLTCNANHTDQCGWMYGQRDYDYKKAEEMLDKLKEIATAEQIQALATLLRPYNNF